MSIFPDHKIAGLHPAPAEGEVPEPVGEALRVHIIDDHGIPAQDLDESNLPPEAWHTGMHSEKNDYDLMTDHWHFDTSIWEQHKPDMEYVSHIGETPYYIPHCKCGWKSNIRSDQAAAGAWSRHVITLDEKSRRQKAGPTVDRSGIPVPKRHAQVGGGFEEDEDDYFSRCPACGELSDYCQGHGTWSDGQDGISGDVEGAQILEDHFENDVHTDCDPDGCDEAGEKVYGVCDSCKGTGESPSRCQVPAHTHSPQECKSCDGSGIAYETKSFWWHREAHGDNEHLFDENEDPIPHDVNTPMEGQGSWMDGLDDDDDKKIPEHYHDYETYDKDTHTYSGWDVQSDDYIINDDNFSDNGNISSESRFGGGYSKPSDLAWQNDVRSGFVPDDTKSCDKCDGSGEGSPTSPYMKCDWCKGQNPPQNCNDCEGSGIVPTESSCDKCEGEGSVGTDLKDIHKQIYEDQHENGFYPGVIHLRGSGSSEQVEPCEHHDIYKEWSQEKHKNLKPGESCKKCGHTPESIAKIAHGENEHFYDEESGDWRAHTEEESESEGHDEWGVGHHDYFTTDENGKESGWDVQDDDYLIDTTQFRDGGNQFAYSDGEELAWQKGSIYQSPRSDKDFKANAFKDCEKCLGRGSAPCDSCKGTGESKTEREECPACEGSGIQGSYGSHKYRVCDHCHGETTAPAACDKCEGQGTDEETECGDCHGQGERPTSLEDVHHQVWEHQHETGEYSSILHYKSYGAMENIKPCNHDKEYKDWMKDFHKDLKPGLECKDCGHTPESIAKIKTSAWLDQVTAPYQQDAVKQPKTDIEPVLPPVYNDEEYDEDWMKMAPHPVDVFANPKTGARDSSKPVYGKCTVCKGTGYDLYFQEDCPYCDGSGIQALCPTCGCVAAKAYVDDLPTDKWLHARDQTYLDKCGGPDTSHKWTYHGKTSQVQRFCVGCKKEFSESEGGEATGFCQSCREKEGLVNHHSWSQDSQEGHYGAKGIPSVKQLQPYVDTGECYEYAPAIARDFPHLKAETGMYWQPRKKREREQHAGHAWVSAPDGTIIDTTHGQFNKNVPIMIAKPGTKEHARYVRDQDMNQDQLLWTYGDEKGTYPDEPGFKRPNYIDVENRKMGTKDDIPPAPGTAPIPQGHVRIYHATWADPEEIRSKGLLMSKAQESYERGSTEFPAIFGYAGHHPALEAHEAGGGANVVEFHLHPDDLDIGRDRTPEDMEERRSTVTTMKDVSPENIVAIHEPWHAQYRMIKGDPRIESEVMAGEHDWAMDDDRVKPLGDAIRRVKRENQKRGSYEWAGGTPGHVHEPVPGPKDKNWFSGKPVWLCKEPGCSVQWLGGGSQGEWATCPWCDGDDPSCLCEGSGIVNRPPKMSANKKTAHEDYVSGPDIDEEEELSDPEHHHPKMWHVSPSSNRESIEREGLRGGSFAFDAKWMAEEYHQAWSLPRHLDNGTNVSIPHDLWEVDSHEVHQLPDDVWLQVENKTNDNAHIFGDPVPPEKLRRIGETKTAQLQTDVLERLTEEARPEEVGGSGGFSRSIRNTKPSDGYMVSQAGTERRHDDFDIAHPHLAVPHLKGFIRQNSGLLTPKDKYFGGWLDSQRKLCLDVSRNYKCAHGHDGRLCDDRKRAYIAGIQHHQEMIFHVNAPDDDKYLDPRKDGLEEFPELEEFVSNYDRQHKASVEAESEIPDKHYIRIEDENGDLDVDAMVEEMMKHLFPDTPKDSS